MDIESDIKAVEALGNKIGYGHLMSLASALWRKHLTEIGVPEVGAFVPTISDFIKDEYQDTSSTAHYDNLIKKIK